MRITNEHKMCSGCTACEAICPKNAITMKLNKKGFLYPNQNDDLCINCGLCVRVCQCFAENKKSNESELQAFSAINRNDEMLESSQSGGLFSALAESVIKRGGVCYGASICHDLVVRQIRICDIKELHRLQGSKYVQSDVEKTFKSVGDDLKQGITVLYSGTSCMIAGLLLCLGNQHIDRQNLYTCDLICYGVPSPKLYYDNLNRVKEKYKSGIIEFNFRNKKKYGWHKCVETYVLENGIELDERYYAELFYSNFEMRECCYSCQYVSLHDKMADISMGDFWGIEKINPEFVDDNRGCSLAIVHTDKGRKLLDSSNLELLEVTAEKVLQDNKSSSPTYPKQYNKFWKDYLSNGFEYCLKKYTIYGGIQFKIKRRILKKIKHW